MGKIEFIRPRYKHNPIVACYLQREGVYMVEGTLLKVLKSLVNCDQAIASLDTVVTEKKSTIEQNLIRIQELEKNIAALTTEIHTKKKEVDLQTLQSRELKEKEEKKRGQLENISNQKEYKALEREIEIVTRKRIELDEQLMKQWYNMEQFIKNNQTNIDTFTENVKQLQQDNKNHTATINTAEQEKVVRNKERLERISDVPLEWRQRYERMRCNVNDPIVSVVTSSCGACYYSVLKQDLTKLKKAEILPCRNCYRLLYFEQEEPQTAY